MKIKVSGSKLLAMCKQPNPHAVSMATGISYPTVLRYTHPGGAPQMVDLVILGTLLAVGCGLNPEQVANLKLGDLFDVRE